MKAIVTFILIMFFGACAMAQDFSGEEKAEVVVKGLALPNLILSSDTLTGNQEDAHPRIAMLFKFRNSLIKESLAFTTDTRRSMLA